MLRLGGIESVRQHANVVLHLGRSLTKAGFGREETPRVLLRTPELRSRFTHNNLCRTLDVEEWETLLEPLLRRIFFTYLRVVPSSRRVVLVEEDLLPHPFRQALANVLFRQFRVPQCVFLSSAIASLYVSGLNTGIVVDVGFEETRLTPIAFGVPLLKAPRIVHIGSHHVNQALHAFLKDAAVAVPLEDPEKKTKLIKAVGAIPEAALERFKLQACYVRFTLPRAGLSKDHEETEDTKTSLPDTEFQEITPPFDHFESAEPSFYAMPFDNTTQSLVLPAQARWKPSECFFDSGTTGVETIVEVLTELVEQSPVDTKRFLLENIILSGGACQLPGFFERFCLEVEKALRLSSVGSQFLKQRLAFGHPTFAPPLIRQWIGGSIFAAATQQFSCDCKGSVFADISMTLESWEAGATIPDRLIPLELQFIEAKSTMDILAEATVRGREHIEATNHYMPVETHLS